VAFGVYITIVWSLFASSAAPTPLYAVYQAEWGFSAITTTVVFSAYCIAVLAALLCCGALSDYIGRRPVLISALVLQAAGMILFALANGVPLLIAGRLVQGLATGAAVGPVGAGMIDLFRNRGAQVNVGVGPLGTATGSVAAGLCVSYLPFPTKLVYFAFAAIFLAQAVAVVFMRETAVARPGALASLRPTFGLPGRVRKPFLFVAPVLIASWALAGLYGAVGPSIVHTLTGNSSHVVGALSLATFATCGGLSVLALPDVHARALIFYSTTTLIIGLTSILISVDQGWTAGFFVATAVTGSGFGVGYQAAVRAVMPLVHQKERAGVLSIFFVVSYLAMGVPTVITGIRVVHAGVLEATREFGIGMIVLAVLALLGAAFRPTPPEPLASPTDSDLALEAV
jgi:MFS family permease